MEQEYYSQAEAAKFLRISMETLRLWRLDPEKLADLNPSEISERKFIYPRRNLELFVKMKSQAGLTQAELEEFLTLRGVRHPLRVAV